MGWQSTRNVDRAGSRQCTKASFRGGRSESEASSLLGGRGAQQLLIGVGRLRWQGKHVSEDREKARMCSIPRHGVS